jgi:hypothetical protein
MSIRGSAALAAGVALAAVLSACGDDDLEPGAPEDAAVVDLGRFDDLPRFPRSEEYGPRTEDDGVVSRSFRARGASVERIMEFYDDALTEAGWTPAEPVHREDGPGRDDYVMGGHRLEVSAIDVEDRDGDGGNQAVVQYSLVLRPD